MYLDSRRSFIAVHSNQPKKKNRSYVKNAKCIFPVAALSWNALQFFSQKDNFSNGYYEVIYLRRLYSSGIMWTIYYYNNNNNM